MYERYGLLKTERSANGKYRVFSVETFTSLIKTRILQSFGFSMKQIGEMMNNTSFEETDKMLAQMTQQIDREIVVSQYKKQALLRLQKDIHDIYEKNGTCELVVSNPFYLFPVLAKNKIELEAQEEQLVAWNEYAFIRQDINWLKLDDNNEIHICYGVEESDANEHGLNHEHAKHIPSMQCVKAYFMFDADEIYDYRNKLGFAMEYIERKGMVPTGDVYIFLPYTSGSNNGRYYQYALIPIEE